MDDGGCDPAELRRRMAFAFTIGELTQLAEELGVAGLVRWDRGPQEAAGGIVKQFEKGQYGGMPTLLTKLHRAKPLVEWPDPASVAGAAGPAGPTVPGAPMGADHLDPIPHRFGVAPPLTSPGTFGTDPPVLEMPPAPTPAPQPDPPPPSQRVASVAALAPNPYAPNPYAPQPPAPWPGTVQPTQQQSGISPFVLVAVAGLMLAAAVVAYLAGRATNVPAPVAAASATPDASAHAMRPDGPATRLAAAVHRGVASIARTCEVPALSPFETFERAFEQCGGPRFPIDPRTNRPRQPVLGGRDRDRPPPTNPREAKDARDRDRDRPYTPTPRLPQAPGASCLRVCAADHASCVRGCGAEPDKASGQDRYSGCMRQCQTQNARCRSGCP